MSSRKDHRGSGPSDLSARGRGAGAHRRPLFLPILAASVLFGCASKELARIDDVTLSSASSERQSEIRRRAAAFEDAKAAEAEALTKLAESQLQLEEAELELESAELRLDGNEALRKEAAKLGLDGAVRELEANRLALRLVYEEAEQRAALARAQARYAERHVSLRQAEARLADAQEEEAKAMAVRASNDPVAQSISLAKFKDQVADARDKAASEHDREARAYRKMEERKAAHAAAVNKLPSVERKTRELIRVKDEKGDLKERITLLKKRVRELERENATLMARLTGTSTVGTYRR